MADSVWAWLGFPLGSSALMPPPRMLSTNSPIVPTNQIANTGQRWRELHIATRTVAGSRIFVIGSGVAIAFTVVSGIRRIASGSHTNPTREPSNRM